MKHFSNRSLIDLSRVDRKRKLVEILAKEALTNRDTPKVVAGVIVQIRMEEEEEEGEKPSFVILIYLDLYFILSVLYFFFNDVSVTRHLL